MSRKTGLSSWTAIPRRAGCTSGAGGLLQAAVGRVSYKLRVGTLLRRAALVAALLACVAPVAAVDATPAQLDTALRRALAGPGLAPSRTSALAVDLRTGEV